MKQHITEKQFNEVDKEKLKKAFGEDGWHWDDITVGRMIGFFNIVGKNKNKEDPDYNSLCDALWEAVKKRLNET